MPHTKLAALLALEIAILVTPMIWSTIPFFWGMVAYGLAALLGLYAVLGIAYEKGLLRFSIPFFDPEQMTLLDLRNYVGKLPGWNLNDGGLQYIDLANSFREFAHKNYFKVWGRVMPRNGMFKDEAIPQEIPASYWTEASLDMFNFPNQTSNNAITTHLLDPNKRTVMPTYFDLEVDRRQAVRWARKLSAKYRGNAEKDHKARNG